MMMCKISDFCVTGSGGTPSRKHADRYYNGAIPWVKSGELREEVITDTEEKITQLGLRESSAKLIPEGALLVAMYGATVGRVAQLGVRAASNQAVCHILPDSQRADTRFVFHALCAKVPEWLGKRTGGAQPNISQAIIRNTEIPFPPLPEQQRIAAILDKADAIRRKRTEAIKLTDQFLKAAFLDMFGDPVTNPKGWPVRGLSDFYADGKNGTKCGPFGGALKKHEYSECGIPVSNMDNISGDGRLIGSPTLWITESKYEELLSYSVQNGDIIISRAGTVGKMCVVRTEHKRSIISTNLIRLRLGEELLPSFFVALMTYCKGRVGRLKNGSDGAFTHMSTGVLDTLRFPYPPPSVQRRFLGVADSVEDMLGTARRAKFEAETLFESTTQRAFRGDL